MILLRQILFRLQPFFRRRKIEAELSEEMRTHLEMQTEANLAAGMSPEEARYAALREFGGVDQTKESWRDERGLPWLNDLLRDLRHAGRSLRNSPGFATVVILVMALGIGANITVFSGIDALLLRPLPVTKPGRLVLLSANGPVDSARSFPYPLYSHDGINPTFPFEFAAWFRERSHTLSDVVVVNGYPMQRALIVGNPVTGARESALAEEVSGNYFPVLGVPAALGRMLGPDDDRPGDGEPVAVVSHAFWQRRLNSDPAVIGRTLRIDNVPLTIVGVAAPGFHGAQVGSNVDLWYPIQRGQVLDGSMPWGRDATRTNLPWINLLGRLAPGVTRAQAASELDGLYQNKLLELDPRRSAPAGSTARAELLEQRLALEPAGNGYGGARAALLRPATILMILVGLLQLAACSNVGGLLLARGAARDREFAVRAAIGASRGRLLRQLLTESLLLATIAGGLGLLLTGAAMRLLTAVVGNLELMVDGRVLTFAVGTTLLTGVAAGWLPAYRLSRRDLSRNLQHAPSTRSHLNRVLVGAQVAFAFTLVAVAGLFVQTFQKVASIDTGFQRSERVLFDLSVAPDCPPEQRAELYSRITDALATQPGVESASYYQGLDLLGDTAFVLPFSVDGYVPAGGVQPSAFMAQVGPRFFATFGIPQLRGRDFGERDKQVMAHGLPAMVISAWSAHQLFGEKDPVGLRIKLPGQDFEVVGVVADVKYGELKEAPRFVFYVASRVSPNAFRVTFVVRSPLGLEGLAAGIRTAVQQIDPRIQTSGMRTVGSKLDDAVAGERMLARLAASFGLFALSLSALGLFGLMSYTVSRRTRELGIRLALGAPAREIVGLVVRDGLAVVLSGCVVGSVTALALTRLIESLLFGVSVADPATYGITGALLVAVALLACLWPGRRAATIDPAIALRSE
jgi:predicted permease